MDKKSLTRQLSSFKCLAIFLVTASPAIAQQQDIRVVPKTVPFFIPPPVKGDREFRGHGPQTSVKVSIEIRNRREIWANVYMRAAETTKDWTTAEGSMSELIYEHGEDMAEIQSPTRSSLDYTDRGGYDDLFPMPSSDLVSLYRCVGDTGGDEAGTRTGVEIAFNPISIRESATSSGGTGVSEGTGTLELEWMGVIDNGEGDGFPRGPKGNFHFTVRSFANGREVSHHAYRNFVVRGPYQNEWLDGLEMSYSPSVVIHRWSDPNEVAFVYIWESDEGHGDDPVFAC